MDQRRWIELTSISGKGIKSDFQLPNPSLFISVNGRHKHTAPPTQPGLNIAAWEMKSGMTRRRKDHAGLSPVWKGPVWIDLADEPDLVLVFDLMAEENRRHFVDDLLQHYGEVNVPINDLLAEGPRGSLCHVSYQVRSPDGRPNGTISFSYKIHQPPPRHTDLDLPPRHTDLDLLPLSSKPPPPQIYLSSEVVSAILAMLPAKVLMKFRCVSKSWNSLMQNDPYFAAQHSNNSKKKPTFVSLSATKDWKYDDWDSSWYAYALNYLPYDGSKARKIDFGLVTYGYNVTNSCNGLVGVYRPDVFYVTNPSIMKLATLPRGSPHNAEGSRPMPLAGIGYEPSTAVYKAVRLFVREYEHRPMLSPISVGCEVFCLGGRSWKSVEDPPVAFPYMERWSDGLCSVVDAAMYWKVGFKVVKTSPRLLLRPEIALSFDLKEEKFGILLHPERSSRPKESSLLTIRESLCIVDMLQNRKQMVIWILKDRKSSEWVKQYTVDLSRMSPWIVDSMMPMTIDGRGIALSCGMTYYDLMSMRIVHRTRAHRVEFESVRPYTESIIWPFCD